MIGRVGVDGPRTLVAIADDLGRVSRAAWRALRWQAWAWTRLPGDRVRDVPRRRAGVIVHVPRPGRVDVVWTTRGGDVSLERGIDARRLWP